MTTPAKTVEEFLQSLPEERRAAICAVRDTILANLPRGYEECMSHGMIGYVVPHGLYPAGYHCDPKQPLPFASLGSQKNHMALYLMGIYADPTTRQWFQEAWRASGKKLDMDKACVRFKKLADVPLVVVARYFARTPVEDYVVSVQRALEQRPGKPR